MSHSYLILSLFAVAAGLVAAAFAGRRRWLVLASGALAAPAGLSDWLFVPEYWQPVHLLGSWFSLEGIMFSFGNGCLIVAVAAPADAPEAPPADPGPALSRLSWLMLPGFAVFLLFWQAAGLMVMHAVFAAFAAMFALLWRWGGLSLPLALRGGVGFLAIYGVETLAAIWLDSGFAEFWEGGRYLALLPFAPAIPIEEYLWAASYGALWANMIGYGFAPRACVTAQAEA